MMTLHSAKGLEFPNVFMVGMEENLFPSARSRDDESRMEEERRLCYVGITRARERLFMSHASRRMLYNQIQFNDRSRFIDDIPARLIEDVSVSGGMGGGARRPGGAWQSVSLHGARAAVSEDSRRIRLPIHPRGSRRRASIHLNRPVRHRAFRAGAQRARRLAA